MRIIGFISCVLVCSFFGAVNGTIAGEQGSGFASDRVSSVRPVQIDGKLAMKYLKQVCAIGPRISGTKGMVKQQELIRKHFAKLGAKARLQSFSAKQESRAKAVTMSNMIVAFYPKLKKRVIICCHYDTRPIADEERDPRDWRKPFVSANDGGSGVAFLMEFGRHLKKLKLKVGVDFVFFDGEEYIYDAKNDKYFFGSKHFAETWKKNRRRPDYRAAVLLDMIAGKNPRFPAEGYSYFRARALTNRIWNIAKQQRCRSFQNRVGDHVLDDHLALQRAGIPAIDIIDFSYRHWHKLSDTPENCSADGMIQVGKVLSVWLQELR